MNLRVEDFLNPIPNDQVLRQLCHELRQTPEEERVDFIMRLLRHPNVTTRAVGLLFTKCSVQKKKYLLPILDLGLETADVSRIRDWLACLINKLGYCQVMAALKVRLPTKPEQVKKTFYWLQMLLPEGDEKAVACLEELLESAERLGILETGLNWRRNIRSK